ncbi:hypothetical protein GP486_007372 [Trichoglossum hirsutum]|uniref:Extracellular serine-rich protein n=1 Tax=Trichoglossum hirsutum TaxID=265104 RepID=A0A9P8L7M2_9PEZI|nr:hypothetical protein GP486_007372 [Trichoglossum hirsutum]
MQLTSTLLLLSAASTVMGVKHVVKVSVGGALAYEPNSIPAAVGDTVEFDFLNGNHSVVQAPFAGPCTPSPGGFFSGFHPGGPGKAIDTFTIDIKDTSAIWFYCAQAKHCQSGMVGVINVQAGSNKTLEAFTAAAKLAPNNVAPPTGPTGGVLGQIAPAANNTGGSATGSTGVKPTSTSVTPPMSNSAMGPVSVSQAGGLLSMLLVAGLLL